MPISKKLHSIDINAIDTEDTEFVTTFPADISIIKNSIEKVGLLQPALLRKLAERDVYQVVSGYKRVLACRELEMTAINAYVCKEGEVDVMTGFLINLHENITVRPLNLIEKSLCLHKLVNRLNIPAKEVITTYLPLLHIHPNAKMLTNHLKLIGLEDDLKHYIVEADVPLINAVKFSDFSSDDMAAIFSFLRMVKLGTNNLRQILVDLEDVSIRDGLTVKKILSDLSASINISGERLSGPQRVKELIKAVRRKRFPAMTAIEKKMNEKIKRLKIPEGMKMTPPRFFEGTRWKVEFQFNNRKELKKMGEKALGLANGEEIDQLMELGFDQE